MSPTGQRNLLLIRRLLHPSTLHFGPILAGFFAQVLPMFLSEAPAQADGLDIRARMHALIQNFWIALDF